MPSTSPSSAAPVTPPPDLDERRRTLVSVLWTDSTHKKFVGGPGRNPSRATVELKFIKDLAARMLSASLGHPSVSYYPDGSRTLALAKNPGPTVHRTLCDPAREIILAKRRRKTALPWRSLSLEAKCLVALIAAYDRGGALAFSLNLGTDLLARLTPGTINTRNVIRNRIAARLRAALGSTVPFIMAMEVTPEGRLHVHGVVLPPYAETERVRAALMVAGSKWTAARPDHQLDLRPLYEPVGWSEYMFKDIECRAPGEQGTWFSMSRDMTRIAKGFYESLRNWCAMSLPDLRVGHSVNFFVTATGLEGELRRRQSPLSPDLLDARPDPRGLASRTSPAAPDLYPGAINDALLLQDSVAPDQGHLVREDRHVRQHLCQDREELRLVRLQAQPHQLPALDAQDVR